ncbi:MAG: DNA-directed RNA polymerase subunit alpha [Candidatus Pacebacteria bacterium]|nr:DNA-directed RNA polymerase subunit alpha [Candidatus Paceibacterota bacterium]
MSRDLSQHPPMNPTFVIQEVESKANYAKMVIEPLEKGYGHTIGNALRRVMLTSLPGTAITKVRIKDVDHQFTTLTGMSEDVIELILNLKQVRIKADTDDQGTLTLKAKGAQEVTAADIECEAGFEIINPDQPIATLAKGKELELEITVDSGIGYQVAEPTETQVIGEIPVDALFSPVIKVSYNVEETRVGRRTDFDRIVLTVETDGTISPLQAVKQAAKILVKQFTQVFEPVIPEPKVKEPELTPEEIEVLRLTVEELDLPTRIANALRKGGFETVGDLVGVSKETVIKVKNLGEKSVEIINEALKKKGVSLED